MGNAVIQAVVTYSAKSNEKSCIDGGKGKSRDNMWADICNVNE